MIKLKVYLIPGWGADRRMFEPQMPLQQQYELEILEWQEPLHAKESLESYVQRLSERINQNKPFALVGVSMGGIMAVELSKIVNPQRLIIVSSVKTANELPLKIKMWRKFPVYQLLRRPLFQFFSLFSESFIRLLHPRHYVSFNAMLMAQDVDFLRWGIHQIVNWNNQTYPDALIHIHGTHDRPFPFQNISDVDYILTKGNHFINIERAEEVNDLLARCLE